jgi:hypothetical protein
MSVGFLWIVIAIVAMGLGTFLQALGTARSEERTIGPHPTKQRGLLTFGTLLTASSVYFLWSGQQILSQEANSKPIVEFAVDSNKTVTITNVGLVEVENVRIFATVYRLSAKVSDGHLLISGVDGYSKTNDPISTETLLKKHGGRLRLDLTADSLRWLFRFYEGIPDLGDESLRTVYCLRIVFRNSVTKQRQIRYLTTGALKRFPDMHGNYNPAGVGMGGGYESSQKLFEIAELIRKHQINLFDDDPGEIYRSN